MVNSSLNNSPLILVLFYCLYKGLANHVARYPTGVNTYEGVSKIFRTESITKFMLTTINTRSEAIQRVMAAKLIRLTHKIAIQLHLVAESCTVCSSSSRRPVRKLLNIHPVCSVVSQTKLQNVLQFRVHEIYKSLLCNFVSHIGLDIRLLYIRSYR
jgi:hypothetical protein